MCLCTLMLIAVTVPAIAGVNGAIFTTDFNGQTVNGNIYASKPDVYLNGGPRISTIQVSLQMVRIISRSPTRVERCCSRPTTLAAGRSSSPGEELLVSRKELRPATAQAQPFQARSTH